MFSRLVVPIELDRAKEPAQIVVIDATILSGIRVQRGAELRERGDKPRYNGLSQVFGVIGASIARATTELK
jgi:hypothetical protein